MKKLIAFTCAIVACASLGLGVSSAVASPAHHSAPKVHPFLANADDLQAKYTCSDNGLGTNVVKINLTITVQTHTITSATVKYVFPNGTAQVISAGTDLEFGSQSFLNITIGDPDFGQTSVGVDGYVKVVDDTDAAMIYRVTLPAKSC